MQGFQIVFSQIKDVKSRLIKAMAFVGKNYSAGIYVLHPFFIMAITAICKQLGAQSVLRIIPTIVFAVSLITVAAYKNAKELLKNTLSKHLI